MLGWPAGIGPVTVFCGYTRSDARVLEFMRVCPDRGVVSAFRILVCILLMWVHVFSDVCEGI